MAVDSDETGVVYELVGVVSLITDARLPDKNNLVATIKVGTSYHEQSGASSVDHWYLFNDIRQGMDKRIIHEFTGKTLRHIKFRHCIGRYVVRAYTLYSIGLRVSDAKFIRKITRRIVYIKISPQ